MAHDITTEVLIEIRDTLHASLCEIHTLLRAHDLWLRDHNVRLDALDAHPPRRRPDRPRRR